MHRLALLLSATGLAACTSSPCDQAALGQAKTAADVEKACAIPADVIGMWTCETPIPAAGDIPALRALHASCGLDALGSQEDFATGTGDPIRAAAVYQWMNRTQIAGADTAGKLLVGAPFVEGITLPTFTGNTKPPAAHMLTIRTMNDADLANLPKLTEALTGFGAWGPFPGWAVPTLTGGSAFAIDTSLDVGTLKRAVASLADGDGASFPVASTGGIVWITLGLPTSDDAARVRLGEGGFTTPEGAPLPDAPRYRLEVSDSATIGELVAALGPAVKGQLELALDHAPCGTAPEGMTCVPGEGVFATHYIDAAPSDDAAACTKAGVCRSEKRTWAWAREYCSWQGKRLPTYWELQRATEAGTVSGAANQWTATWRAKDKSVGEAPFGQCDGSPRCWTSSRRLSADGTGHDPTKTMKGGIVCASTNRWLATLPPDIIANPRPTPAAPTAAPELAKLANAIDQDNLTDKGICPADVRENWGEHQKSGGRSTLECRDPQSYITTNEPRRHVWAKHFTNVGGGYLGVGSDQNYDFIAAARSDWAWVYDYDPNVVRLHHILEVLILESETPEALVERFDSKSADATAELIRAKITDEADAKQLSAFYYAYREKLFRHYTRSIKPSKAQGDFGWLRNKANYDFIRTLHQQDRIIPIGLDLLGTKSMRSVGDAAKKMGIPIRIFYTSNAPTAWGGQVTPDWRKNIASIPMDEESVVLATFNWGGFNQTGYWHYNVMQGPLFQERMQRAGYDDNGHEWGPTWDRVPAGDPDLTTTGLPGAGWNR